MSKMKGNKVFRVLKAQEKAGWLDNPLLEAFSTST